MEEEKPTKNILILGGSTFVGLTFLQELTSLYSGEKGKSQNHQIKIYMINRGKNYWNGLVKSIPNITYINGNRSDKVEFAKLVGYISKKYGITENNKWTSVIDTSSFKWQNIKSVYEPLKNLVKQYVFISTDSVYEVCNPKHRGPKLQKSDSNSFVGEKISEEASIRFTDPKDVRKHKDQDEYGHAKLMCEEYLDNEIDKSQFPYVILRFSDVVGPFDDTNRYYSYVKWLLELNQNYPILSDRETKNDLISFVFSEDISKALIFLVQNAEKILQEYDSKQPENSPLYKPINLACEDSLTLDEIVNTIYKYLPQDKVNSKPINFSDVSDAYSFYPSVDCGAIDVSRAKKVLNWNPTPIDKVIKITTEFFSNIHYSKEYKTEDKAAEAKLNKKLRR